MKLDQLCKDNLLCCDDNCKRCANLIYNKYMEQQEEIKNLKKFEFIREFTEKLSVLCEMYGCIDINDIKDTYKEMTKNE